jgi:5-methylcytosine-specific restriction endonuclease McrA
MVILRNLKNSVIESDHGTVTYLDHEWNVVTSLIASVDHKKSLVEGGTNDIQNLVPSCRYCNEARAKNVSLLTKNQNSHV